MGISSKKQKTTEKSTQNTSSTSNQTSNLNTSGTTSNTTMATNPEWVTGSIQDLVGKIGGLGDPGQYVSGPSTLQQQAFAQAGGMQPSGMFGDAAGIVKDTIGAQTPSISGARVNAPSLVSGARMGQVSRVGDPTLGPVERVGDPTLGPAAQASGAQFSAASIDPNERIRAASLLEGLDGYVNPMLSGVVDTTLRGFDKSAAQQRAQLAAKGAQNRAFGGSRFGLAEGQFGADIEDKRAATEAGLRSDAYDKAFGYSSQDAGRRQEADTTNASLAAQRAIAQAQQQQQANAANAAMQAETSRFNTGETNAQSALRAQLGQQAATTNAGAANSNAQLLAQLTQQAGTANANAENEAAATQAGFDQRTQEANQGAQNTAAATQAGFDQRTQEANQGAEISALQRALEGAGLLGQLGTAQDASTRANTGLLADLGGQQRDIQQEQLQAPISLMQTQAGMLGGLPLNMFGGQTSTGTNTSNVAGNDTTTQQGTVLSDGTTTTVKNPSLLQGIGQGAESAAALMALFSDRRLKRNIKFLEKRGDLNWYSYNYVWGGPRQEGVMADEVKKIKPEAVLRHDSGFLMVNYGSI